MKKKTKDMRKGKARLKQMAAVKKIREKRSIRKNGIENPRNNIISSVRASTIYNAQQEFVVPPQLSLEPIEAPSMPQKKSNYVAQRVSAAIAVAVIIISVLALISTYGTRTAAANETILNISNVSVSSITITGAEIAFVTNELADTGINYGTSQSQLDKTYEKTESVLEHKVALTNLSASTKYYFRVMSTDANGNTTQSGILSFTTLNDTAAPTWSNPSTAPESPIAYSKNQTMEISIGWADDSSLASALFQIDNSTLKNFTSNNGNTYSYILPTPAAGEHAWHSSATDSFSNTGISDNFTFTVQKASPEMHLYLDSSEGNLSISPNSTVTIASSTISESKAEIILDGNALANASGQIQMSFPSPGTHTISLRCNETQNYSLRQIDYSITVEQSSVQISTDKTEYGLGDPSVITVAGTSGSNLSVETCGPIQTNSGFAECRMNYYSLQSSAMNISNPYTNKSGNYAIDVILRHGQDNLTASTNYTVMNTIAVTIDGTRNVATGTEFSLTATAAGGIAPYIYNWTLSNGSRVSAQTITLKYNSQGSYPAVVYVRDREGNDRTETASVYASIWYALNAYVLDSTDNSPIQGARVTVNQSTDTTDDNGNVTLLVPSGSQLARISASGYNSSSQSVNMDSNKSITIKLDPKSDGRPDGGFNSYNIDMLLPSDGAALNAGPVTIKAYIDVQVKRTNCSIYLDEGRTGWFKEIQQFQLDTGSEISISPDLKANNYSWRVECLLPSGRKITTDTHGFSVAGSSSIQTQSDQTQAADDGTIDAGLVRNKLEEAMNNIDALDYESKLAADMLGVTDMIDKALKDYDRTMRDINSIRFRNDLTEDEKTAQLNQYKQAMQDLEKTTPMNVKVISNQNFVAYPKKEQLDNISKEYRQATKMNADADPQELLLMQNKVVVNSRVAQMELTMVNGDTKTITAVERTLNYKDNLSQTDYIIEYIPKDLEQSTDNIVFLTDSKIVLKDPIARFEKPDKIVYYFNGLKDIEKVKTAATVLLNDGAFVTKKSSGFGLASITGNIALTNIDFTSTDFLIGLVVFILALYLAYAFGLFEKLGLLFSYFSRKKKLHELMMLINDAIDYANIGDLQKANMIFKEVKLNYERCQFHIKREVYEDAIKAYHHLNVKYFESTILSLQEAIKAGKQESVLEAYRKTMVAFRLMDVERRKPYDALIDSIETNIVKEFKDMDAEIVKIKNRTIAWQ